MAANWRAIAPLLPLFLIPLCLGPQAPADSSAGVTIDGNSQCPAQWVANCSDWNNQEVPLTLRGLREAGGIIVRNVSHSIIIDDVETAGAIHVLDSGCENCSLEIRKTKIDRSSPSAVPPAAGTLPDCEKHLPAVCIRSFRGSVKLSDLDARVLHAAPTGGDGQGIVLFDTHMESLVLERVSIVADPPSQGRGLYWLTAQPSNETVRLAGSISFKSVKAIGFYEGARISANEITLDDVAVVCLPGTEGAGILVNGGHLSARSLVLRGCAIGLSAFVSESANVANSTFTESGVGALVSTQPGAPGHLILRQSRFANNSGTGLQVSNLIADISDASFSRNGLPDRCSSGPVPVAGLLSQGAGNVTVRASSFEGSGCFAAASANGLAVNLERGSLIDARENWWGTVDGPVTCPKFFGSSSSLQRPCVSEDVQFVPFKTQP